MPTTIVQAPNTVVVPSHWAGLHVGLTIPDWKTDGGDPIPSPPFPLQIVRTLKCEVGGEEERSFWSNIETSAGVYDWSYMDAWMAATAPAKVIWVIYGTPSFYQKYPGEPSRWPSWSGIQSPPSDAGHTALRSFAQLVKSKYGDRIIAFEVWNEPTLPWTGSATSYSDRWSQTWGETNSPSSPEPFFSGSASDLANIAYTLSSAGLGVPILGAAFVDQFQSDRHSVTRFLNAPVTLPGGTGTGKSNIDALSIHFYDYSEDPSDLVEAMEGYRAKLAAAGAGDLPIWNTEMGAEAPGATNGLDAGEVDQVKKWMLLAAATGCQSAVLYAWASEPTNTENLADIRGRAEVQQAFLYGASLAGKTIVRALIEDDGQVRVETSDGLILTAPTTLTNSVTRMSLSPSAPAGAVVGTARHRPAIHYELSNSHGGLFAINQDTGEPYLADSSKVDELTDYYTFDIVAMAGITEVGRSTVSIRNLMKSSSVAFVSVTSSIDEGITGPVLSMTDPSVSSWEILDGVDSSTVRVVSNFVEFLAPTSFSAPGDSDEDNVYEFRLSGRNAQGQIVSILDVTATVLDVTTTPLVLVDQSFSISGQSPIGTVVGTVLAWVEEGETPQDFTITGGPGSSLFSIDSSTGVVTVSSSLSGADVVAPIFVTVSDGTNTSDPVQILIEIASQTEFSIEPSSISHAPVMELIAAINCGSATPYTHTDGTVYQADAHYTSGSTASSANPIAGTANDALYQTERWGSTFWYDIPVPSAGLYKLTLHFAETFFTAADAREFTVRMENGNAGDYTTPVLDLWTEAGGKDIAYDLVREVYIDGTSLDLDFVATTNNAAVKGIRLERVSVDAIVENENNSGTTNFAFNVVRSGVTTGASSVDWEVVGTGAHPAQASDFVGGVLPSGTVSFSAGELVKQILIPVQGDTTSETNETFEVRLSNPSAGSTVVSGVASATIYDDDFSGPTYRYYMVDTDSDSVIAELSDGQTLQYSQVIGRNISFYATAANVTIGSARLQLDSGTPRTENVAPYALYGDVEGTDFLAGQPLSAGSHTLTVNWYSEAGAAGTLLNTSVLTFTVASSTGSVTLVNTNSAQAIAMGEAHPPGSRLPIVLEIQNAPAGVYWSEWIMVSDPDNMFEAVNHGVALKGQLDYSTKTSHTGTVRVVMRDGSTGDFSFTLSVVPFTGTEYHVATNGNDSNPGTLASPFATLSKLASVLTAGDIGHVKAGNYGTQRLLITAPATFAEPIVVRGYQVTPGDNPKYASWNHLTDTPSPSLMPCIDKGTRENDDYGLLMGGSHVFICNFTVSHFLQGAYTTVDWTGGYNLFTREAGRTTVRYSGRGVSGSSSARFVSFKDCYCTNANSQAITIAADYGLIVDCGAYCDNNDVYSFEEAAATDYYAIVHGKFTTIRRVELQRAANVTTHGGHGVQSKAGEQVLIEDVKTINLANASGFRHAEASFGVLRRFEFLGTNGLVLRDGVHDCLIENGVIDGAYLGIMFIETTEGEAANPGNYSALNNLIRNVTIKNCSYAISTRDSRDQPGCTAKGNVLENLNIQDCSYLFYLTHPFQTDNLLKDSTLTRVSNYQAFWPGAGMGPSNNGFQFSNTQLQQCGFTLP